MHRSRTTRIRASSSIAWVNWPPARPACDRAQARLARRSPPTLLQQLAALDFAQARADTVQYWEDWLAQGAQFEVPEQAVNDLFRANLWHALMLPRLRGRHGPH